MRNAGGCVDSSAYEGAVLNAPPLFTRARSSHRQQPGPGNYSQNVTINPSIPPITPTPIPMSFLRLFVQWFGIAVALLWTLAALTLVAARWIDPPTTAVHIERRLQAWIHNKPYQEHYKFIPLSQISPQLQHAVIAAEDARFYHHHGFDWNAIQIDAEEDLEGGRTRGASTITQQLVKNLFFGTSRSILRKGAETTLVPVAEFVLGKQRILESTSMWSNGAPVFMALTRLAATTTRPRLGILTGMRRHAWPRFCRLHSSDGPNAWIATARSSLNGCAKWVGD